MELFEISDGLWRWTAPHPEWREGAAPESGGDWPRDVGCVAHAAARGFVLIDALIPAGSEGEPLLAAIDRLIAEHGGPVFVLTTIGYHRRSRDELASRYEASTSRARERLPEGVEAIPLRGAGETVFWLPASRALVPGDRIIGDRRGGLRMCPESWLPGALRLDGLREKLRPLLELPVERVLVSHGEPVLRDARAALAAAVGG